MRRRPSGLSPGEELFALQARGAGLPSPEREHRFHPERRWRFDFAWPARRVALEIEGVLYAGAGGRHQRGSGYEADLEKYLAAAVMGWTVLRVSPRMVKSGAALEAVECILGRKIGESNPFGEI